MNLKLLSEGTRKEEEGEEEEGIDGTGEGERGGSRIRGVEEEEGCWRKRKMGRKDGGGGVGKHSLISWTFFMFNLPLKFGIMYCA